MNKLENLLAKVFYSVCNEIDGSNEHISEDVTTKEIIEICEEHNLTDLKNKLVKLENAYDDCDYDKVNNIVETLNISYPWDD